MSITLLFHINLLIGPFESMQTTQRTLNFHVSFSLKMHSHGQSALTIWRDTLISIATFKVSNSCQSSFPVIHKVDIIGI